MWGLLPPAVSRTLKLLCVLKVLGKIKQRAKFQHRISMQCIMQLCEYVFPLGLPLYVPQNVFSGFEGEEVKILCSDLERHHPA